MEVLLCLSITLTLMFAISPLCKIVLKLNTHSGYNEDIYIGVKQISQYLIGSSYLSLDDSYSCISRDGNEITLYESHNKLIKKPGYEVLLYDIENVSFEIIDSYVYIFFQKGNQDYKFLIGYVIEEEIINEE